MADITINIDALTESLRKSALGALPWVKLQTISTNLDEITPPSYLNNNFPTVMLDPLLIPNSSYVWTYKGTRQLVLDYMVQRGTTWETGKIKIFHTAPATALTQADELTPPAIPFDVKYPPFFIQTVENVIGGGCGVVFTALYDPSSTSVEQRFGLGYRIISATNPEFPMFAASYVSVIPTT